MMFKLHALVDNLPRRLLVLAWYLIHRVIQTPASILLPLSVAIVFGFFVAPLEPGDDVAALWPIILTYGYILSSGMTVWFGIWANHVSSITFFPRLNGRYEYLIAIVFAALLTTLCLQFALLLGTIRHLQQGWPYFPDLHRQLLEGAGGNTALAAFALHTTRFVAKKRWHQLLAAVLSILLLLFFMFQQFAPWANWAWFGIRPLTILPFFIMTWLITAVALSLAIYQVETKDIQLWES